ncbi:MAG: hypothetical protein DI568_05435 [Sphingomonas sp.]|nr:MAG: hypothetical protein DI568_05435 [Sphingomonas sp.]
MSGSSAGGYGSSAGATVAIADRISILGDLGTTVNGFIVADVHGIVHGTPASDYWNSTSRASFYVSVSSPGIDQFYRFNIPESISGIYDERIEIPFSLGGNSGINWMQFNAGLGMQLSGNWVMDFGNTVSFSIILPDGYSYVSAGGLTFRPLNPSTGGVPEPAIWAMMIAGFGLTGAALRRRQRVAAVLG